METKEAWARTTAIIQEAMVTDTDKAKAVMAAVCAKVVEAAAEPAAVARTPSSLETLVMLTNALSGTSLPPLT